MKKGSLTNWVGLFCRIRCQLPDVWGQLSVCAIFEVFAIIQNSGSLSFYFRTNIHFFQVGPPRLVVCPPPPPPPVIVSKMHPLPAASTASHLYAFRTTTTIQVEWLGISFSKNIVWSISKYPITIEPILVKKTKWKCVFSQIQFRIHVNLSLKLRVTKKRRIAASLHLF